MIASIPLFSGHKPDFHEWKSYVYDAAEQATTLGPHGTGLLGYLLPTEEWFLYLGSRGLDPTPYTSPVRDPGPQPEDIGHLALWFKLEKRYSTYCDKERSFRTAVLNSLDQDTKTRLNLKGPNLIRRSLREIWAIILVEFESLSSSDIDSLEALLKVPLAARASLSTFISKQAEIHDILERHGQPLNEHHKLTYFQKVVAEGSFSFKL